MLLKAIDTSADEDQEVKLMVTDFNEFVHASDSARVFCENSQSKQYTTRKGDLTDIEILDLEG